jgi:hypothetical protein
MAGLSLNIGGYGGTGALPTAAGSPTGTNVSQAAFGVTSIGSAGSPRAAQGAVAAGILATAVLVFLWHSLPR